MISTAEDVAGAKTQTLPVMAESSTGAPSAPTSWRLSVRGILGLLAAVALVSYSVWVWFSIRDRSNVSLGSAASTAFHDTARALGHVPKGLHLLPLVALLFFGLGLTGRIGIRLLRVPVRGVLEATLVSVVLGVALFIPWLLLFGTYGGLTAASVWLIFIGFDLLGVLYAVWNGDLGRLRRRSWRLPARSRSGSSPRSRIITIFLSIVIVATLYQVLLGALVPEVAFDARWYHLGLPAHYVTRGHYYNSVADNSIAISGGPFYQEILYAPFYSVFGQIGAKLVNFIDLILLCMATFAVGRRITASRNLALCSVILVLALPVLTWEGTSAQNDIGMAVPVVVAFYCFLRWTDDTSRGGWLFAGFAGAGIAAGTKVFGASSIVFLALGSLLVYFREYRREGFRKRDWKPYVQKALKTYAVCGLILIGVGAAGLIRSAAMTGDPVFPGLYHLFNTPYWSVGNSALIPGRTTYSHVFTDLFSVPWDELMAQGRPTTYNTAQWGPLIVLFAPVAAISLLWRRNRVGDLGFLWLAVVVSVAWWYPFINGLGTRYLMPAAPLFAVGLVALLARLARSRATRLITWCSVPILTVTVLIGQPFTNQLMPVSSRGAAQGSVVYNWRYLFGSANIYDVQERYLPLVQYVNTHVPESARIWDAGSLLPVNLYVKPEVFSGWSYDSPHAAGKWDICSQDASYWMGKRGIDYFTVPAALSTQFASSALSGESTKLYSDAMASLYKINSPERQDVPFTGSRRLCS